MVNVRKYTITCIHGCCFCCLGFVMGKSPFQTKKAPPVGRICFLGGGFNFFLFSPLPGAMIQFDEHMFQMGWCNHHLVLVFNFFEKIGLVAFCSSTSCGKIHPGLLRDRVEPVRTVLRPREFKLVEGSMGPQDANWAPHPQKVSAKLGCLGIRQM